MGIAGFQKEICRKFAADFLPFDTRLRLGIADDFFSNKVPLNGLRHRPENGTSGWYLWAGEELPQDEDYCKPIHGFHLAERHPDILKHLGLAPGWRFFVAGD